MCNCVSHARRTQETSFRADSECGHGRRNVRMADAEFETPLFNREPGYRNIAYNPVSSVDRVGGKVIEDKKTLGAAYYPPKRDQIRQSRPPVGSAGKL